MNDDNFGWCIYEHDSNTICQEGNGCKTIDKAIETVNYHVMISGWQGGRGTRLSAFICEYKGGKRVAKCENGYWTKY